MKEYFFLFMEEEFGRKQFDICYILCLLFGVEKVLFVFFQDLYMFLKSVYCLLCLNENVNVWLFQLFDVVVEFDKGNGFDLKGFFDYYVQKKYEINVQILDWEKVI